MADWRQWNLADTFANPEDYFRQCVAGMAGYRKVGINTIRASPNVIGYNLTGTQDQGFTGEGLTTTFRELKPGTVDAMFDVWRTCAGACSSSRLQSIAAASRAEGRVGQRGNRRAGDYPVRLQVVGPLATCPCSTGQSGVTIARSPDQAGAEVRVAVFLL